MAAEKNSKKRTSEFHGILLVDKPEGMTSHDVVDRVRRIFKTRRVGHTGTLDPQATGLLVLMLGEATKISEYLMGVDKSYEGTIKFGVVTNTYDREGKEEPGPGGPIPTDLEELQDLAGEFAGEIMQTPPPYSAKKVAGKKLYEYARKGEDSPATPRKIRIDDFEILNLTEGISEFGVDCSAGTYVRSLVHDLGQKVGCGATLIELRRTDVGAFGIEDALTLDDIQKFTTRGERRDAILNIRAALGHMPAAFLLPGAEHWVRNGQAIPHNLVHTEDDHPPVRGSLVLLCRPNSQAVAVARVDPAPMSPPPRALQNPVAPWYQPIKQFEIPIEDLEDDDEEDIIEEEGGEDEGGR